MKILPFLYTIYVNSYIYIEYYNIRSIYFISTCAMIINEPYKICMYIMKLQYVLNLKEVMVISCFSYDIVKYIQKIYVMKERYKNIYNMCIGSLG